MAKEKLNSLRKELDVPNITDKSIFLSVPSEIINQANYLFLSGGTTSNPKVLPFNEDEWMKKNKYRAKCYKFCGVDKKDKAAIMLPFGPWIAGPSAQCAMEELETSIFPLGTVDTDTELKALLDIIIDNKIKILITTPSFLSFILRVAKKHRLNLDISKVFTSGEITCNHLRKTAKEIIGATIYSCYASSEGFIGIECEEHNGYHFDPMHVILEVYDNGQSKNTLLLTVKDSILVPIIRYEIGDLGQIYKNCPCGSKWPKVMLLGRNESGFLINGAVNVYPYQIKEALFSTGLNFIECNITVTKLEDDIDLVNFIISIDDKSNEVNKDLIEEALKAMSIDFSDSIHHGIVKIRVNLNFVKRDINEQKSKIKIKDERIYE